MKQSSTQSSPQLRLTFETDESKIWESIEIPRQQEAIEHLASLWLDHVVEIHRTNSSSSSSSDPS